MDQERKEVMNIGSIPIESSQQILKTLVSGFLFLAMLGFATPWTGQAAEVHQVTTHPALEYFPPSANPYQTASHASSHRDE